MKRSIWTLITLLALASAHFLVAQAPDATEETATPGARGSGSVMLDHQALEAYKAARVEELRQRGRELETDLRFVPLKTPVKMSERRGRISNTNITYDTGTINGTAGQPGRMAGNRFNSALNDAGTLCCFPVETSGSITMITFNLFRNTDTTAIFSIYSDIMGTTAKRVTMMARSGVMVGLNTLTVMSPTTMNAYMNGSFLAGIWQANTAFTALAFDTDTTAGQGFHGISINDGATGSQLTSVILGMRGPISGANAIFRVSGDVATPVELMSFEIEED